MSYRATVTLTDEQHRLLREESRRRGVGLSELVRVALDRTYGTPNRDLLAAIDESFGAWEDRDFDGESYVENLRRGLGERLAR